MTNKMSSADWDRIFPSWSTQISREYDIGAIFEQMIETPPVRVISAVFLPQYWQGIADLPSNMSETPIFRAGRWCVTDIGVVCLGEDYEIESDRLDETDWFAHLLGKTWLYDPSDLLDALEAARKHFLPHETVKQRFAATDRLIQTALSRQRFPYYPPEYWERTFI